MEAACARKAVTPLNAEAMPMCRQIRIAGVISYRQPNRLMFWGVALMLLIAFFLSVASSELLAAPFAKDFQFTQPDSVRLTLWGEGDEFHDVFETTSGYTAIFDAQQRVYFYAEREIDGKSLISTGAPAHMPAASALPQHIRMDADAANAAAHSVIAQARYATDTSVVSSRSTPFDVAIAAAETVSTPSTPSGISNGLTSTSYFYGTGGSSSSEGHSVQYLFDWGDGTNSGWLPVGQTSASKSWSSAGTYSVMAQARCATDTSVVSSWSASFSVVIELPETVSTPLTPWGPSSGQTLTYYYYSTGGSSSSKGHGVFYRFDWGDGTNSGWLLPTRTYASKYWSSAGTYSVKAQARCITDTSVLSSWSESFNVIITAHETYSISGQVMSFGNRLSGVTIKLTGTQTGSTTTDSSGNYSFSGLYMGPYMSSVSSYTLTPSLDGYTFSPLSRTFENLSSNQTANFIATFAGRIITTGPVDFDGDGTTDIGIYRQSTGTWYILESSRGYNITNALSVTWGNPALFDIPATGDFDGDGKTDIAVYRQSTGEWFILTSSTGYSYNKAIIVAWGRPSLGDQPVVGDFDGDGKADIAIYRPGSGQWFILTSSSNYSSSMIITWGNSAFNDQPVVGDFDGDGKTDIAIYRQSTGEWFILTSSTGYSYNNSIVVMWGCPSLGDQPVVGDYDGDGRADIAVYRPSSGQWFILTSSSGYSSNSYLTTTWGNPSLNDSPVRGDFDGDRKMDIAIYRQTSGDWFILKSSMGYSYANYLNVYWGDPGLNDLALGTLPIGAEPYATYTLNPLADASDGR
jgi:hypothetical protein